MHAKDIARFTPAHWILIAVAVIAFAVVSVQILGGLQCVQCSVVLGQIRVECLANPLLSVDLESEKVSGDLDAGFATGCECLGAS